MSAYLYSSSGGAVGGWVKAYDAAPVGAGASVASGATIAIGDLTWRNDDTGQAITIETDGVRLQRAATAYSSFTFDPTDLGIVWEAGAVIAVGGIMRIDTTPQNASWVGGGAGRVVTNACLESIAGGFRWDLTTVQPGAQRLTTTGTFSRDELGAAVTLNTYVRFAAIISYGGGVVARWDVSATAPASMPASPMDLTETSDGNGVGSLQGYAFPRAGIHTYLPGLCDVTFTRLVVYTLGS